MFRKYLSVIAAVLCCGAFTACGSSSSSSSSTASSAASETEAVTDAETTTGAAQEQTTAQAASGGENDQTAGSGSKKELTPQSAKGGDITGQWVPESGVTSLDSFIDFGSDGSGTLYVDLSGFVSFADGKFSAMGVEASGEDLVVEKDSVKAYLNHYDEDSLLLELERIDGGDSTASLDGEYKLAGGRLTDTIGAYIDGEFGGDAGELPITAVLDGSSALIKLEGAFSYTVEGSKLNLAVMSEIADKFSFVTSHDIFFTAENDKLYIVTSEGDSTIMTRRTK